MKIDKNSISLFGFRGKILEVDLTNKLIKETPLDLKSIKDFIGGAGYACRFLIENIDQNTNPLSPENILIIMTGPYCLSGIPGSGRFVICSKSPYTNLLGESNCGGSFGPEMKKAGYDGIFIKGKAESPVYLNITNHDNEILDANSLWGLDIKKNVQILKEKHKNSKILTIGQAGENLVKFASINAEGKTAGRTGMGAVMGSKNLKAIVVYGNNSKIKISNPNNFKKALKQTLKYILNQKRTEILREYGTSAGVITAYALGDLPIKYWSKGKWDDGKIFRISGEKLNEKKLKTNSCYNCPIGCGKLVELRNDKGTILTEGPEYETIAGFGSLILNDNLESIKLANLLCNMYGLDTISTSSAIGFLFKLYNEDYLDSSNIDGLKLNWGNKNAMLKLIEKIAFRKGIGNILANGSQGVVSHFNLDKNLAATINNMEVPYHDIRSCFGMALTYTFSPRGPCHTSADVYKVLRRSNGINFTDLGIEKTNVHSNKIGLVKSTIKLQDYRAIYSSLILCVFCNPPPKYNLNLYNSIMGTRLNLEEFLKIGERIFNLKRIFNNKMGLTQKNDQIPQVLLNPTKEGIIRGKSPKFIKLKKNYYKIRNWDPKTGEPRIPKLEELGLKELFKKSFRSN